MPAKVRKGATPAAKKPLVPGKRPRLTIVPRAPKVEVQDQRRFAAREKLAAVVAGLGHNATAAILGVDRSQLSRILKGDEHAGAELQQRAVELDYVISRLLQVMHADEIGAWLDAPEPLLDGAIPMNVLRLHGPDRVIHAINAIAAGSYS